MAKILAWVTIIGLLVTVTALYFQLTDDTAKKQLDTANMQLKAVQEQTRLMHELLEIQGELLRNSKDNLDVNRRISEIEARLARIESGPQATDLQRQLDDLRRWQREHDVVTHDLKYRIHDIEVALRKLGVEPAQYEDGWSGTPFPTLPPLDTEETGEGAYPDPETPLSDGLVRVSATDDWQDSGVEVVEGQLLRIAYVDGTWGRCADPPVCPDTGPDGDNMESENDPSNIIDGCKHASLIARVGSALFCVGSAFSGPAPGTGRVALRINDRVLTDNRGWMTIRVNIQ